MYNIQKLLGFYLYLSLLFLPVYRNQRLGHSIFTESNNMPQQEETNQLLTNKKEKHNLRLFQSEFIPIRITHNYAKIMNSDTITLDLKLKFQQLVSTVELYFSKLLKIKQNQGNNVFKILDNQYSECYNFKVPDNDKTEGIPNSDLHIYYELKKSTSISTYLAASLACSFSQENYRPNFGLIIIDAKILKLNSSFDFQESTKILIHEFIHILGFSRRQFIDWRNENKQEYESDIIQYQMIRDKLQAILISPNVVKTARKYYNCSRIEGMQLENQQKYLVSGHWETTLLFEEIQVAEDNTNPVVSIFTIALLKDTGFWDQVNENMAQEISWGKNEGCEFFYNQCISTIQQLEFSDYQNMGCDFNDNSKGKKDIPTFSDGCFIAIPKKNGICQDDMNRRYSLDISQDQFEAFSYDSKCFISNLYRDKQKSTKMFNNVCYRYQCSESYDQVTIIIYDISLICSLEDQGQFIEVNNDYMEGQIKCPNDYQKFCQNRQCKNFCNSNGICINSVCHCLKGYLGEDCSTLSTNGYLYKEQIVSKCPQNYFVNPDYTCQKKCPRSFYANKQTQKCEECDFSCSKCTGPSKNECIKCQFLTKLFNGQCVSQCPIGFYLEEINNQCLECKQGCSKCTSHYKCSECIQGYTLIGQLCGRPDCIVENIQEEAHHIHCKMCTDQVTECVECFNNYYLDPVKLKCV